MIGKQVMMHIIRITCPNGNTWELHGTGMFTQRNSALFADWGSDLVTRGRGCTTVDPNGPYSLIFVKQLSRP